MLATDIDMSSLTLIESPINDLVTKNRKKAALQKKAQERKIKSGDLIDFLREQGYDFKLNLCDDSVEVNGERLNDVTSAKIRNILRDAKLGGYISATFDAVTTHAAKNAYHPVRNYLENLVWDGAAHIAYLAGHFTDENNIIGLYLRKWLIGAVARANTSTQNAMLVLDGQQGIGKSQFVKWLCSGIPEMFVDSNINPDNKDDSLLAIRRWIWEVSELGATTRRADVEALKSFLSRQEFTVRAPYGHYELTKPGLASFIGTVNNSSGIFSDKTGSRRFFTTTLTSIDWDYSKTVDINQVWAEAVAAYQNRERWTLNAEESARAQEINANYERPDPIEDMLYQWFEVDAHDKTHFTSTSEILTELQTMGLNGNTRANASNLAETLKKLGLAKERRKDIRGYVGIWKRTF